MPSWSRDWRKMVVKSVRLGAEELVDKGLQLEAGRF